MLYLILNKIAHPAKAVVNINHIDQTLYGKIFESKFCSQIYRSIPEYILKI